MSNFEKFNYDNEDFYTRDTTTYLIKGTQSASTNAWTGNLPDGIDAYKEGLTIDYFLPYAGNSNNATLNLSQKGAIPVQVGDSSSSVTNQFPQNSVIRLTYVTINGSPVWKVSAYYSGGSVSSIGAGTGLVVENGGNNPIESAGTLGLNLEDNAPNNITHYLSVDEDGVLGTNILTFFDNGGTDAGLVPEFDPEHSQGISLLSSKSWRDVNICDTNGTNISTTVDNQTDKILSIKLGTASSTSNGLMSSTDKDKLDTIADKKLEVTNITSGAPYYPVVAAGSAAAIRQVDTTGFNYTGFSGTTNTVGNANLTLGNSTASGTTGNKQGKLILYGSTSYAHTVQGAPTAARTLTLPNATGTLALTSDIPSRGTPTSGGQTLSLVNTGDMYTWNNKGTVSSVTLTSGSGITVSNSGTAIVSAGTRTISHSNSVTAQSTQAVYPITIDSCGHISSYGSAVAVPYDYVIEEGSKDYIEGSRTRTWYYRKWNNGKVEAWFRGEIVFPSVTTSTNGFYLSSKEVPIPDNIFSEAPIALGCIGGTSYDAIISVLFQGIDRTESGLTCAYSVSCKQIRPTQSSSGSGRILDIYCWTN